MTRLAFVVVAIAIFVCVPGRVVAQPHHECVRQGNAAFAAGQYDAAASAYRLALTHDPTSGVARANLGLTLFRLGDTPRAVEALTQAADAFVSAVDKAAVHYSLGTILATAGRLDEALAAYRTSLRLSDREDARVNHALVWTWRQQSQGPGVARDLSPSRLDALRRVARELDVAIIQRPTPTGPADGDR